jgi:hypothetical protein
VTPLTVVVIVGGVATSIREYTTDDVN